MYILPIASNAMEFLSLASYPTVEAISQAQIKLPEASSFERKVLALLPLPALRDARVYVAGPGSKSCVPINVPETNTLPSASVIISQPTELPESVGETVALVFRAHTKLPWAFSFSTKPCAIMFTAPRVKVPGPGSKSQVSEKKPVT